jgi:hypothetical protein
MRYNVADVNSGALEPAESRRVIEYPISRAVVDFVAYYPYSGTTHDRIDSKGIYTVPLTDQNAPEKIDVLIAKKSEVSSGPVQLQFRHALSKITLNIKLAQGVTAITDDEAAAITDVKLMSTPGSAKVDINTGYVADGPNAPIAMLKSESPTTGYAATFSAVVAPTNGFGGGRFLTLMVKGRALVWSIPATDLFEQGKHYVYSGELTQANFNVNDSEVKPWENNNGGKIDKEIPAKIQRNNRITWDSAKGQYALTTDPTNGGLYFLFGSVVGIYSAKDAVADLSVTKPYDVYHATDVAWAPTDEIAANGDWSKIPVYSGTDDYPKAITPESGYHTVANVKAGKGDPCRLVGLDLAKIKQTAADKLTKADIDNGRWRLPTVDEQKSFSGRDTNGSFTDHFTTLNGVKGGMFPNTTVGDGTTFLPLAGDRTLEQNSGGISSVGIFAGYWSSTPRNETKGSNMSVYSDYVHPESNNPYAYGFSVRCVRQ